MSYEGTEVYICTNGHIHLYDCYSCPEPTTWKCKYCSSGFYAKGQIDMTNGLPYYLRFKLIQKTPPKTYRCKECGSIKTLEHATYKFVRCDTYISENGSYIFY